MSSGSTGYDTKTFEHLKFFADTQAWLPKNAVIANKKAFDALDKATQDGLLKAAAEAEKTRLQGEGQANYRREIANGIVDQIKSLQAVGMNIGDVNNVVLFNQYLDVLRSLSESNISKTVVLPASTPGGYQDMYSQITQAMVTANETAERSAYTPKPSHTAAPSVPRI